MIYKFSPSSLNLLKECPKCFWLHFNKNLKRPSGIFPSLPNGMDGVLKKHFDKYMEKSALPPEIKDLNIKLFEDKELLKIWRSNFKGIQFTDTDGNFLRGAVDNILVKDNKLIVMDYKTRGYPLKEDTAHHYQNQLDLYNYLLRKNGYQTEDYSYLLFYHPLHINEDGSFVFKTDLVKMNVSIANAENILKNALSILNNEMPDSDENCEYCKFAEKRKEESK
jgi:hypothetical protein